MRCLKKWFENGGFSGLMNEIYMVLLARAGGDGVFKPNVAEKSVLGPKNLQIHRNFRQKVKIFTKWVEKKHFGGLTSGIDAVF